MGTASEGQNCANGTPLSRIHLWTFGYPIIITICIIATKEMSIDKYPFMYHYNNSDGIASNHNIKLKGNQAGNQGVWVKSQHLQGNFNLGVTNGKVVYARPSVKELKLKVWLSPVSKHPSEKDDHSWKNSFCQNHRHLLWTLKKQVNWWSSD